MSIVSKRRKGNGDAIAKPQLTSLLDVMTILLVFLIQNFSSEGNLLTVPKDLTLAESVSKNAPVKTMTIEVGLSHIALDGERMGTQVLQAQSDDNSIPELYTRLESLRTSARPGLDPTSVTIQCDKGVDFGVLKRILATCSKAKVQNFSLLVRGAS